MEKIIKKMSMKEFFKLVAIVGVENILDSQDEIIQALKFQNCQVLKTNLLDDDEIEIKNGIYKGLKCKIISREFNFFTDDQCDSNTDVLFVNDPNKNVVKIPLSAFMETETREIIYVLE